MKPPTKDWIFDDDLDKFNHNIDRVSVWVKRIAKRHNVAEGKVWQEYINTIEAYRKYVK